MSARIDQVLGMLISAAKEFKKEAPDCMVTPVLFVERSSARDLVMIPVKEYFVDDEMKARFPRLVQMITRKFGDVQCVYFISEAYMAKLPGRELPKNFTRVADLPEAEDVVVATALDKDGRYANCFWRLAQGQEGSTPVDYPPETKDNLLGLAEFEGGRGKGDICN